VLLPDEPTRGIDINSTKEICAFVEVSPFWQQAVKGFVIPAAVAIDKIGSRDAQIAAQGERTRDGDEKHLHPLGITLHPAHVLRRDR